MSGVTDIREWKNALKEFPDDMESDVFKVLQYSYDRLRNANMQECFLYCALYPEDCKIIRDELIGRFMMEGMVKGHSRQDEFNQGHTILNQLVKLCLLEATDDRGYEAVKMHDLLREMALRITNVKPRYMVRARIGSQLPEEQDWAFDLDKVSFFKSGIYEIPEDVAPNCPKLSTLLLPYCRLRRIPESFLQQMNNLQVLDLSYNSTLVDLPSCISNLGSLRALLLRKSKHLRSVPPLGKLKNLRILDVSYTRIKEVPQGMENLLKLKFLNMAGIDLDELPKEILPELSQLQYLYLPLRMNARVEDLSCFELLEEFGGRFCDLRNFYKFMRNRRQDCWYDIKVSESPDFIKDYSGVRRVQQRRVTFEDLHLENLVGPCKGKIASHTFSGLIELEVKGCDKMKNLFPRAIFQDLKNLEKLYVTKCKQMEEIIGRDEEQSRHPSDLPKLKELYLYDLPKLKRICEGKLMCDSVVYMKFRWCPNLKTLPFYTPTTNERPFPSLRRIYIYQFWWERLEWDQPHVKTLLRPYIRYLRD